MAIYKQSQYTTPLFRWSMAIVVSLTVFGGLLCGGREGGFRGEDWIALPVALVGFGVAVALLFLMRLDLRIDASTIRYRMFPLEWKEKTLNRDEILQLEVFRLPRFPKYGGMGRRRKPWSKEVAYIMSCRAALRVRLRDGRVRVFSIERPAALIRFLRTGYEDVLRFDNDSEFLKQK